MKRRQIEFSEHGSYLESCEEKSKCGTCLWVHVCVETEKLKGSKREFWKNDLATLKADSKEDEEGEGEEEISSLYPNVWKFFWLLILYF